MSSIAAVNQNHIAEVERTLLLIAEARERAERVARSIKREEGDPTLVEALEESERALLSLHTELSRTTYFPVLTEQQLRLAG